MAQLQVAPTISGIAAEADGEIFETYNEDGTPLGRELRAICHQRGIWHRAVYALLFNTAGELLIQRRSLAKKVSPGQWDLSVAEHLSPGETFLQGVVRGLSEELGVKLTPQQQAALQGPLTPMHQRKLIIPERGIQASSGSGEEPPLCKCWGCERLARAETRTRPQMHEHVPLPLVVYRLRRLNGIVHCP